MRTTPANSYQFPSSGNGLQAINAGRSEKGEDGYMQKETSPYTCHIFVCTNDRHGERKSCADGGGNAQLKDYLKDQVEKRGWKGRVRVSSGGCMGLCGKGPNVMIYPQKAWFAVASPADGDRILGEIEMLLSAPPEK